MNKCQDCNICISSRSKRCRKCAYIDIGIRMSGINNWKYDPDKIRDPKCITCGAICSAIQCRSCYLKSNRGKDCPTFKHGNSTIQHYCVDCKIPISWRAKRCRSCNVKTRIGSLNANFGKKHPGINAGKNNHFFGKPTPHGKWTEYNGTKFRSTYEATYAEWLDKNNIKWQYEHWTFNLGDTTYTPDFYLPEYDKYIEVKGYWREDAKEKFVLFRSKFQNIRIRIVNENLIKSIRLEISKRLALNKNS